MSSRKPVRHSGIRSDQTSVAMKFIAVLAVLVAVVVALVSLITAFMKEAKRNTVDLLYGSVSTPVSEGEAYSEDMQYSALDVFGRLNWTFARQPYWYGEYDGYVNTVVQQDVHSYKYYQDGMLIAADITKSSLVNAAREFCYIKDVNRVLWREATGGPSTYNKLETPWREGEPHVNIPISGSNNSFKALNGLPAYELSVYVIEPDTVLGSHVEKVSPDALPETLQRVDGDLYKVTFILNPNTWTEIDEDGNEIVKGANAYYVNQMIFTGGLPEAPEFKSLTVSYYFDENWVTYQSEVSEEYSAAYGPIKAPCVGGGTTSYFYAPYGEGNPYPTHYDDYFQYWINAEPINPGDKELTALDALAAAFGALLTEPTTLSLDLDIGGAKLGGTAFVDLSKTDFNNFDFNAIEARIGLGALNLWIEGGRGYLNYGGVKLSLGIEDLVDLINSLTATSADGEGEGGLDTEALLGALANGEFILGEGTAELHSVLPLAGLEIPLDFYFLVDEEKNVTLDHANVALSLGDTLSIAAEISFGGEAIPALTDAEKADCANAIPHIESLIDLFTSENFHIDLGYTGYGVEVEGSIDLAVSPFALQGKLTVRLPDYNVSKLLKLAYQEGKVYLDLGGVKLTVGVEEALAFIGRYFDFGSIDTGDLDLGGLIGTLLSPEFAENLTSSEEEGTLAILIRGTELLKAFGVDFALGDVSLEIADGSMAAKALGAEVKLTKAEPLTEFDTTGYIDIVPYAERIADLIAGGYLHAEVSYASEIITAEGTLDFDISRVAARAKVTIAYMGAPKTLDILYANGLIYLSVDGLHIKANVEKAIGLVAQFVEIPATDVDALELVSKILSLDFEAVIQLSEAEDTLTIALAGTELLRAFGLDFDLGSVELTLGKDFVAVDAYGARLTVTQGEAFGYDTDGFVDVVKYAEMLLDIYHGGWLRLDLNYAIGGLTLGGVADIDLTNFNVQAALKLSYGTLSKTVDVRYAEGDIFLGIDGIRVKVNAEQAAELLGGIFGMEQGGEEIDWLETVFNTDFAEIIPELWESNNILHITIASGKLLSLFGIDYDFGEVRIAVSEAGATIKLGKAVLTATAGEAFTPDTEGYIDVIDYIEAIKDLIGSRYLLIDVNMQAGDFTVTGNVLVDVEQKKVCADLFLDMGTVHIALGVVYDENGTVYINLDGAKIKANGEELIAFIQGLFANDGIASFALMAEELETPAIRGEVLGILEKLLSVNFDDLFKLVENTETNSLELIIAGSSLLEALGVDFNLGDITVSIKHGAIEVNARATEGETELYALTATLTKSEAFELFPQGDEDTYIDVLKYVQWAADILTSQNLTAEIVLAGDELTLGAMLDVAVDGSFVRGTIEIAYRAINKSVGFLYSEGMIYLDIDGVKVKAAAERFASLLSDLVVGLAGEKLSTDEYAIMTLAAEDFSFGLFSVLETVTEEGSLLTITVCGEKLLELLGVKDFDLGRVELAISERTICLVAGENNGGFTASVVLSKHDGAFEAPTEEEKAGYVDIFTYVDMVAAIFENPALLLELNATLGKVNLGVTFKINKDFSYAQGTISINGFAFEAIYATAQNGDAELYLTIGDVKLKANVSEAIRIIDAMLNPQQPLNDDVHNVLENILSLKLGDILKLTESAVGENSVLTATVLSAKIFEMLGINIGLDRIELRIEEGRVVLTADRMEAGVPANIARVTFAGITAPIEVATPDSYKDVTPVIERLCDLLLARAIEFSGELRIGEVAIVIHRGVVSWAEESVRVYLNAEVAGVNILFSVDHGIYHISVADFGIKFEVDNIEELIASIRTLIARIEYTMDVLVKNGDDDVGAFSGKIDVEVLVESLQKILDVLEGTFGITLFGDEFSLDSILAGLLPAGNRARRMAPFFGIENGKAEYDDIFTLKIGSFTLSLLDDSTIEEEEDGFTKYLGFLGLSIKAEGGIAITGEFHTGAFYEGSVNTFPTFDDVGFYDFGRIAELIDYLGAAIGLFTEHNLSYALSGNVTDEAGVEKYTFTGSMDYYDGGSFPLNLDLDGDNFWVNTDLYLHATLNLIGATEAETTLWLDVVIVDYDDNEELDFFISVSTLGEGVEGFKPLKLYAPAGEVATLLASFSAMLGLDDAALIDNYLVSRWLDLETKAQLRGLGNAVLPLLAGLIGGSEEEAEPAEPAMLALVNAIAEGESEQHGYFALSIGDTTIYLDKEAGEDGRSVLTYFGINTINDAKETIDLGFEISREFVQEVPTELTGYLNLKGLDRLIFALSKSATHVDTEEIISGEEEAHTYALNRNFYINGSVEAQLIGISITINIDAVSVTIDENGELGVNVRLSYKGKAVLVVAINGDSTVDLTIKNGMIYMKRVQTTEQKAFSSSKLSTPITLYRAMPLDHFMDDILNQMSFIFNFGPMIADQIANAGGGGETEPTEPTTETLDIGAQVAQILKAYTYVMAEDGSESWTLQIDGMSFSNDILGDTTVQIATDSDGYIRKINIPSATIKIPSTSLSLGLKVNLNWRNPGGVMESGVTDVSVDMADTIGDPVHGMGAMLEKLNAEGWGDRVFLEAEEITLKYAYVYTRQDGKTTELRKDTVMVSTGKDGFAARTFYGRLVLPDLAEFDDGYQFYGAWADGVEETYKTGSTLPADATVYAQQHKYVYKITFWSTEQIDDRWDFDNLENRYYYSFEMEYGSIVNFVSENVVFEKVRVSNDPFLWNIDIDEIVVPNPYDVDYNLILSDISETGATFTVKYDLSTIVYHSNYEMFIDNKSYGTEFSEIVVSYEAQQLPTPTSIGYDFIGWKDSDGNPVPLPLTAEMFDDNKELHLYADWQAQMFTITLSQGSNTTLKVEINGTQYSGSKTIKDVAYNAAVTVTASASGGSGYSVVITTDPANLIENGKFKMPAQDVKITTKREGSCIVEGTPIMLADGTQKPVEAVTADDVILIFNHESGKYEAGKMWYIDHAAMQAEWYTIVRLNFSDGTNIGISYRHGFFDLDLNQYIYIEEDNFNEFIGHRFTNVTYVNGEFVSGAITLVSATIRQEYVRVYGPISEYHFNMVNAGLLSMPSFSGDVDGFMNYFEYGEGMKYDEAKMQADIEQYGLFTYEDFKDYISEEDFNKTPAKYFKVAIGKGMLTWEEILWSIQYLYESGGFAS